VALESGLIERPGTVSRLLSSDEPERDPSTQENQIVGF